LRVREYQILRKERQMSKKNKAVVFGINGQDGSYLAELLLSKNYEVTGVYRRSSVNTLERVQHLLINPDFKPVMGDVTDFASIYAVFSCSPDEVYNLAAQSHVAVSFEQPINTWNSTAAGCVNVLEAIRCYKRDFGKDIKLYQASSSEMFGDRFDTDLDGLNYQDESTYMNPQSPYAVAKLAAHKMVQLYRKAYGIHGSCGILFNHESERRGENFVTRKITRYVAKLYHYINCDDNSSLSRYNFWTEAEGFPKLKLGNLDARRDWGHAQDYVYAMWLMLQQDKADDYVISTGVTHSIKEFLTTAFNVIGIKDWSNYVEIDPRFIRPSVVPHLLGKANKAKEVLGWEPSVSFDELVYRMVNSDIQNEKTK